MTTNPRWWGGAVAILAVCVVAFFLAPRDLRESAVRTIDKRLAEIGTEEAPVEVSEPRPRDETVVANENAATRAPRQERVRNTGSITGTVVTEKLRRPVQYVRIHARSTEGGWYDSDETDEHGAFRLNSLPRNTTIVVRAENSREYPCGAVPETPAEGRIDLGESNLTNVEIVLAPEQQVRGTVVDSAGTPRPWTRVGARRLDGINLERPLGAESNGEGLIAIGRLSPGDYEFVFPLGEELVTATPEAQRFRITKGESLDDIRILCPDEVPSRLTVSGVVTDNQGKPVSDASIYNVDGFDIARTDARGHYLTTRTGYSISLRRFDRYENIAIGVNEIVARHPYYSDSNSVRIPDSESAVVNFVLPPLVTVEGRVVDAQTGRPISKFKARGGPNSGGEVDYTSVDDPEGRFVLKNVKAGAASVWIDGAQGYAANFVNLGTLIPGETRRNIEVRLSVGCEIEGRIVDTSGRPIRLAKIAVEQPVGSRRSFGIDDVSNDDGYFFLTRIPMGPVKIVVQHEQYAPTVVSMNVVPGVTSDVRVILNEGGGLRGRVTRGGKPVTGGTVVASFLPRFNREGKFAPDGSFEIRGMPDGPGRLRLMAAWESGQSVFIERPVEVLHGEAPQFVIDLAPATATVEGRVSPAPEAQPEIQATIVAYALDAGQLITINGAIDEDGRFRIKVPSGDVRLAVGRGKATTFGTKLVRVTAVEDKTVRHDIRMDGGATLYVDADIPKDVGGRGSYVRLWLLDGEVDVSKISGDFSDELLLRAAATGMTDTEGQATIGAVEPGTYTAVAVVMDRDMETAREIPGTWDAKVVTIGTEDEVVSLDLRE